MAAQQQQQYNRGILPAETLNALDCLVDRLNASSGRLPASIANNEAGDATPPIRALLVGTNEGVGLSRSLGSAHTASQLSNSEFSFSGDMSEEVLSSIETVWATLVSSVSPHVMAAAASASNVEEHDDGEEVKHNQPPHPLLSPLQLGDTVKTVTACYDHCTLVHIHMPPLVVTLVASPEVNLGSVKSVAIPMLKVLLEPVRRALVRSRGRRDGQQQSMMAGQYQQQLTPQQQQMMQQQQQQQGYDQRQMQQQGYGQGRMMHGYSQV